LAGQRARPFSHVRRATAARRIRFPFALNVSLCLAAPDSDGGGRMALRCIAARQRGFRRAGSGGSAEHMPARAERSCGPAYQRKAAE